MDYIWFMWASITMITVMGLIVWAIESFQHWFADRWDREVRRRKAREKYEKIIKSKET